MCLEPDSQRPKLVIPEMDAQHDYLYARFERLTAPQARDDLKALLDEIEGILDFNFTGEEQLMRHYHVPGFAEHQADHGRRCASRRLPARFHGWML